MNESRPLPPGLRQQLEQALELVEELRAAQTPDEEVLHSMLDDLKSRVADALTEVRRSSLPEKDRLSRSLRVAEGILLYLTDPTQRDARGRLRDVAAQLRETLA